MNIKVKGPLSHSTKKKIGTAPSHEKSFSVGYGAVNETLEPSKSHTHTKNLINIQEGEIVKGPAAVEAKSAMLRSEGSPQFINFINMERHPNDQENNESKPNNPSKLLGFSKLNKDYNKIIRFKKKIKAEL